jgi:hypothetical protein
MANQVTGVLAVTVKVVSLRGPAFPMATTVKVPVGPLSPV